MVAGGEVLGWEAAWRRRLCCNSPLFHQPNIWLLLPLITLQVKCLLFLFLLHVLLALVFTLRALERPEFLW